MIFSGSIRILNVYQIHVDILYKFENICTIISQIFKMSWLKENRERTRKKDKVNKRL